MNGKAKRCALLAAAAALLAGCSPKTAEHVQVKSVHDTVRVAVQRVDTFKTGDTLRVYVRERGDTVTVWRDRVRWRTQVREAHDTVWASRTDTVTRVERVTVERPRGMGDWLWPMAAGAMAGAAAALYLFNRKNKSNAEK